MTQAKYLFIQIIAFPNLSKLSRIVAKDNKNRYVKSYSFSISHLCRTKVCR